MNREKRRSQLDIYLSILQNAAKPIRPTRLMYATNLNYRSLTRYLQELNDRGFLNIHTEDGHKTIKTTDRGFTFLDFW